MVLLMEKNSVTSQLMGTIQMSLMCRHKKKCVKFSDFYRRSVKRIMTIIPHFAILPCNWVLNTIQQRRLVLIFTKNFSFPLSISINFTMESDFRGDMSSLEEQLMKTNLDSSSLQDVRKTFVYQEVNLD